MPRINKNQPFIVFQIQSSLYFEKSSNEYFIHTKADKHMLPTTQRENSIDEALRNIRTLENGHQENLGNFLIRI